MYAGTSFSFGCSPALFGSLHAQEIRIRVLNAHNGKPVPDECVNVFVHGIVALPIPTDKQGVAVLRAEGEHANPVTMGRGKACNGLATPNPTVGHADSIRISGDYYVACQEYGKAGASQSVPFDPEERMPSYSIKRILESGIAASNTCGKFRAEPKPGELILFVRPMTWLEKWRL